MPFKIHFQNVVLRRCIRLFQRYVLKLSEFTKIKITIKYNEKIRLFN